ncbi:LysR family transcriptional regulator [Thiothrix nivea]|uniref:Transcriptional regulator, LysR family n=1 Tax=Thiothrix nivea (strain ATCC 35100 / DSM 5205 / JP2) TaxID=870187 RepID=A0A656HIX1_THINJ|nr:LysR family transcriptional regulator [Thiothrix nivea]EIJ36142.1 transcriptional regulator, LysR family [Thiothrix nivea DSM 5205]
MDINHLNAFIEVARHQSFSLAAEALFITQPAISKRIHQLENELGTPLFNRINRKVTLTEAGHALLPRVQALRNELEDIRRVASNLSGNLQGFLVMGTSHHIGLRRLPPALTHFNREHPSVRLDLHFVDSEQACLAVERGELELALITLPTELPEQLQAQHIWTDRMHIVANPDHHLSKQSALSLEELVKHRCVMPGKDTYTYRLIRQALAPYDSQLDVYINTNYLETLKMLVSAGLGWSLLPHTMLDDKLATVQTPLTLQRYLGVIFHRKRTLSNAAKILLSILEYYADHLD